MVRGLGPHQQVAAPFRAVGEHRVQLQQAGEQSPERVVRVGEQHTMENPVRVSYDFRSRQFGH